ncbi:DeoR/GlpR family DNA-binding transcription regulator [Segnochrobactrum spirostomi]|uniref:DeoR/GlpR transcriptional regulator n=1 Tax=Segnochrobactrum spirostomi TaxID=2608987 RepID=A0A6A7Y8R9_9HYPH|nr:DeoR/GlpR family DNA-binding transcription regulator [Segnochrobactrum spirostomi]MQT15266.1 DeoR/GlpR transcriptional regulator [Segnochrobactrum spirostomi]
MSVETRTSVSEPAAKQRGTDRQRMLSPTRHERILEMLRASGTVSVTEMAETLAVSDMTVRRDLVELERAGRLERVHGGAVIRAAAPAVAMDSEEPSFTARLEQRRGAKERIAAEAASIIAGQRAIALDVGTTTFLLAEHLKGLPHAKIFTNSLRIATALAGTEPEVYVPGGRLRADEMSLCGPTAVAQFEQLWFDVCVIGVSGVTSAGLFDYSFDDTELKRVYLRRSGLKIVLCDSTKFRRMSLVQVAALEDISLLITEAAPPPDVAAALAQAGVEVRIAAGA